MDDRLLKSFPLLLLLLSISWSFNNNRYSLLQFAAAWDAEGHQAIGMTAMSTLHGKSAAQVKRLMGGKDLVDVAAWGHHVEAKHPKTAAFHFQYQPTKWECSKATVDDANCPDNQCLVRALQHFYGRLTGQSNLMKMSYPDGLQLTDSDALRYLVNLVGDLHQPLHVGFAEDLGGQRNLNVTLTNSKREKVQSTLFNYWDSALVQKFVEERPAFWYGGWTHSHSLGDKLAPLRSEWESEPAERRHLLFEKWATESLGLACSNVYKDALSGAIIPSGYEVTSAYEYTAMELIKTQILTAGARLGLVLNSILSERGAVKLRQGSGVEIQTDDEKKFQLGSSSQAYFKSFCINLAIVFVVLAVLVYITRFYAPSAIAPAATTAAATRAAPVKHLEKRS